MYDGNFFRIFIFSKTRICGLKWYIYLLFVNNNFAVTFKKKQNTMAKKEQYEYNKNNNKVWLNDVDPPWCLWHKQHIYLYATKPQHNIWLCW